MQRRCCIGAALAGSSWPRGSSMICECSSGGTTRAAGHTGNRDDKGQRGRAMCRGPACAPGHSLGTPDCRCFSAMAHTNDVKTQHVSARTAGPKLRLTQPAHTRLRAPRREQQMHGCGRSRRSGLDHYCHASLPCPASAILYLGRRLITSRVGMTQIGRVRASPSSPAF